MKFTEAKLEEAIISLLGAEGYPHILGETIDRQSNDVLIKEDLRAFLSKQYAKDGITPGEIESVILKLDAFSSADLYESNKQIMRLVSEGFYLKRERNLHPHLNPLPEGEDLRNGDGLSPAGRDGSEGELGPEYLFVQLLDYSSLTVFREPKAGEVPMIVAEESETYNAGGNIFKLVNQLEIIGSEKRIPDGILYINGLPLMPLLRMSATGSISI
jgi:type I restriction enzyme R subunit